MRVFLRQHGPAITAGILVLITYVPAFIWMKERWLAAGSYYTHGPLIPLISLMLVWQARKELRRETIVSSPLGLLWILCGLLVLGVASWLRIYFLLGASLIMVLSGLTLHFYGDFIWRRSAFAHVFLIFMVPLPMVIITQLSFQMKIYAAKMAAVLLKLMQIDAVREGAVIRLARTVVIVDDVCSGLRSLVSLLALGVVMAYWMKAVWWRRGILVIAVIPVAIVTNIMRVVLLSLISEYGGVRYATGWMHDVTGVLVFAGAFVLMFALSRRLS